MRDELVLAVSRPDLPIRFGLPGGSVEDGESFAKGAARELYEETGFRAVQLMPVFDVQRGGTHLAFFYAPSVVGKLRSSHEGVARWVERAVLTDKAAAYPDEAIRALWIVDVILGQ